MVIAMKMEKKEKKRGGSLQWPDEGIGDIFCLPLSCSRETEIERG